MNKQLLTIPLTICLCLCTIFAQAQQLQTRQDSLLKKKKSALSTTKSASGGSGTQGSSGLAPVSMPIMPSPTAASLVRNATASPNLYTGAVNVSIPLYTLPAQGMSIPIGLVYQSNGVKVNEKNGPLGMSWNLQGGGAVARIVRGYPDEFKGELKRRIWTSKHTRKQKDDIDVFGFWHNNLPTDYNENQKSFEKILKKVNGKGDEVWDTEPDKYLFSAPGLSGSFYLPDRAGKPIVHCDADIDIQTYITKGQLKGFVITTSSGACYEFGMYDQYLEKQIFSTESTISEARNKRVKDLIYSADWKYEPHVYMDSWMEEDDAFTSTWYLKRIILPFNADVVTYSYETDNDRVDTQARTMDVVLDNALNYYEFVDGGKNISVSRVPEDMDHLLQVFTSKQTTVKIFEPKRLTAIACSSGKAVFEYSPEESNKRITELLLYGKDRKSILKKFDLEYNASKSKITSPSNVLLDDRPVYRRSTSMKPIESSDNNSNENAEDVHVDVRTRYFLCNIKELDRFATDTLSLFSFEYHKPEFLPEINSQMQNHLGYYINYSSFQSFFAIGDQPNYYSLLAIEKERRSNRGNSAGYQDEHALRDTTITNGILVGMQNATGAHTRFVYDATYEGAILKRSIVKDGKKRINQVNYSYKGKTAPYGNTANIYPIGEFKFGLSPWGRTEQLFTQGATFGYNNAIVENAGTKTSMYFTSARHYNNKLQGATFLKEEFESVFIDWNDPDQNKRIQNNYKDIGYFLHVIQKTYPVIYEGVLEYWVDTGGDPEETSSLEFLKFYLHHINQVRPKGFFNCKINYKEKLVTQFQANVGKPTERDQLRGRILRKESYNLKGKLSVLEEYKYSIVELESYNAKKQPLVVSESYVEADDAKYIVPYRIDYQTLRLNKVKSTSYVTEKDKVEKESGIERYSNIHMLLPEVSWEKNLNTGEVWKTEASYLVFRGRKSGGTKSTAKDEIIEDDKDDTGGQTGGSYPVYDTYPWYSTQKQEVFKNGKQLSGSQVIFDENTRLPKELKSWINNEYETMLTYDKFDSKGRILQAHGRDGIPTAYRYKDGFLELSVQNATYDDIRNGKPDDLREKLNKSVISSANYSPQGFITDQTDANGYKAHFEYDSFGRLHMLRDHDKNLVKAYEYQYGKVGQETTSSERLGIGQMVIGETFVVGGYTASKTEGLSSAGKNFIASYGFKKEGARLSDKNNPEIASASIEYQDALGRRVQQLALNVLPQQYSLLQSFQYDSLGRQPVQYRSLPLLSDSKYKKNWEELLKEKYGNAYKAESSFDAFNRVDKQGKFGEDYSLKKRPTRSHYKMNERSISSWEVDLNSENFIKKTYEKGTLFKTAVYYEGITNIVYKNMAGQVVRKAAVSSYSTGDPTQASSLITDYVYDDYGNLRAIVPPQAKGDISKSNYVYKFLYDKRNRLVKKEIPGAGSITMEYDDLDRLIHETDAKGVTTYIKYDELNRPIETGYYDQKSAVSGQLSEGKEVTLSRTFYDDYDFDFAKGNPCSVEHASSNIGRITGSETRILGSDIFIKTVSYYDEEGQVVEVVSQNNSGGIDKVNTTFDFTGKVTETRVNKTFNGKDYSSLRQYDYGQTGELLNVHHGVNGASTVVLSSFAYNNDGSLAEKKVHNGKIKTDYTYDELDRFIKSKSNKLFELELAYDKALRGTDNKPRYDGNLSAVAWKSYSKKRHTYSFSYDNWKNLSEADSKDHPYTTSYMYDRNGNLSMLKRRDSLCVEDADVYQHFEYDYNYSNQIHKLWRKNTETVAVWPGDTNNDGKVDVDDQHGVGYNYLLKPRTRDKKGYKWEAHKAVQRKGDELVFSDANGDGLVNELDTIAIRQNILKTHKLEDPKPTKPFAYEYDLNGNMVYDEYKRLRISYNIFNLPDTIRADKGMIVNQYLADGTLLRRSIFDEDENEIKRIDYQGEFLFVNGKLAKVFTEEGYYEPREATKTKKSDFGTYFYTLQDHLGHTRVVVDEEENVLQETAYYPYGGVIEGLSSKTKYNYLYTGKELVDDFGLNWYDHHARYYDAEVGRWWAIDPALQASSPYMAMGNNPMMMVDENGEFFIEAMVVGGLLNVMLNANKIDNFWDGLGYFGVGAAAGAAGYGIGTVVSSGLTFGGTAAGSIIGGASGFASSFVSGAGNSWLSGASLSSGIKSGMYQGLQGSAVGTISGGLIRGITDAKNGYNFWDGSKTEEFVVQGSSYGKIAKNYNTSPTAQVNDDILKARLEGEYGVSQGDYNITKITTKTSKGYGMNNTGKYVKMKTGDMVGGYLKSSSAGHSHLHVSPYYALGDDVAFKAIAGHELIHGYHHFMIPSFKRVLSERVAYRYTYNTYMSAGQFKKASDIYWTAMSLGYWGSAPALYQIPIPLGW
ncbi:MAG: RHS repeat-associated core domain-containing protein [Bacteroidales bacterium]